MNFFKKLTSLFSSSSSSERDMLWIAVRCNRCGEMIRARVNLYNDLSANYDDHQTKYTCRKELVGAGTAERPCFQRVEVTLIFDERRKLIEREISGGQFLSE